jgi:hypothetical protein
MKNYVAIALLMMISNPHAMNTEVVGQSVVYEEIAFGSSKVPEKSGCWNAEPAIFVCAGAPVNRVRVENAISVWERLGYKIHGPFMNSTIPACLTNSMMRGMITISLNGQDFPEKKAAITRTYRTKDGAIVGAKIEIKSKWSRSERVLEHELGHALGWDHYSRRYHMMNPIHDYGGWDMTGLKNKCD